MSEPAIDREEAEETPTRSTGTVSRIAVGALGLTALYGVLLALLAGEERGGLSRLIADSPLESSWWLLGGYLLGLLATAGLGLWALARAGATSTALVPAILLLAAGGTLSAIAGQDGATRALAADEAQKHLVMRAALAGAAFPRVVALMGASILAGLAVLVGLVRLYQRDLGSGRRWGPFAALLLALLLAASLPATWASLSISVGVQSLLPLASTHYMAIATLAFAFPRALRLRDVPSTGERTAAAPDGDDDGLEAGRALLLVCLGGPLATLLAWQASVAAASAAPLPSAGAPLRDALTLLGPQALGVTIALSAIVALGAGPALRRAVRPRPAAAATIVLALGAAATYVWAAITAGPLHPS